MPSSLRRTRRRALNISRSFVKSLKSHFYFLFGKAPASSNSRSAYRSQCPPLNAPNEPPVAYQPPPVPGTMTRQTIGRQRQLRRRPVPTYPTSHFIHRLPVEILSHVFVLGSEDDVMLPVVISHVCSSWRTIAFRTPALWRRITLTPRMDMWRERMQRARACSLDISISPWVKNGSGNSKRQYLDIHTVQWYMHLVVPYIHRWRSLEIQFDDYSPYLWNAALFGCCSRGNKSQALMLEELSLSYPHNDEMKEFSLFSGCAPRLRRVTLEGIRLTWLPSLFGNLTYLDYTHHAFTWGHDAVNEVLNMLQVSSRLTELHVLFPLKRVNSLPPSAPPQTGQRITLRQLTHLHIRVDSAGIPLELAHLLSLVHTPSLISLRFIDLSKRQHSFPNLSSFFQLYSLPRTLRIVRIEHGWYDQHLIFPLLYTLPNVRHLVVRRPYAPDLFYDLISRRWKAGNRIEDTYGYSYLNVESPPGPSHSHSHASSARRKTRSSRHGSRRQGTVH
ncbi:hypothetical protein BDN72DRAFT_893790 [Pluteus cervinus]|uniref:Uncharacterized protein n=1 Tax=Pluteus cervinus TaxID=181527 RepID=A0ACD3B6C2_9AGAR|nr:hypothetical protein BDN72DRAFT_893790 [Pluteus cervinus]